MKKIIALLLALVMCVGLLAACGAPAGSESNQPSDETNQPKKVTALFFSLEGEFFQLFDTLLKENLTGMGYEYESQSSNGDPLTMIEQIENAVAGGTDLIWTWALSGEAVADALNAARQKGVNVYCFVQSPGEANCDVFRGTDETACGYAIAQMAMDWADKVDPETPIKTIIMGNTDSQEQKERYEAIIEKLSEDSRFVVLEALALEASTVKAQEAAMNMIAKHGDVDCFITPSGEMALGCIAYVNSEASTLDPAQMAVFGTECNEEIASYIRAGIMKGTIMNGGNPMENAMEQCKQMDKLLKGEETPNFSGVDLAVITAENLEQFGY